MRFGGLRKGQDARDRQFEPAMPDALDGVGGPAQHFFAASHELSQIAPGQRQ